MTQASLSPRLVEPHEVPWVASQWCAITGDDTRSAAEMEQRLRWWLGENPAGAGALAVSAQGDQILGVAGWCPKRLAVGDASVLVAEIGHTMTAPAARGKGVFGSLVSFLSEVAAERSVVALYGTPNAASGKPYVERQGFTPFWRWRRWLRPRSGGLGAIADVVSAATCRLGGRGVVIRPMASWADVESVPDTEWGHPHLDRSVDYLDWRYPTGDYERLLVERDGTLLGWVVVGTTVRLGRPAMSIADVVFTSTAALSRAEALRRVVKQVAPADARSAFTMTRPGSELDRPLLRAGFVPKESEWEFIAKAMTPDVDVESIFHTFAFRAGDSDTV